MGTHISRELKITNNVNNKSKTAGEKQYPPFSEAKIINEGIY